MALQPGLCRTWSETPKTGFLTTRPIKLLLHVFLRIRFCISEAYGAAIRFYNEPRRGETAFCICENKGNDRLHCSHAADLRLCFKYIYRTIPLLPISKISSFHPSSLALQPGLCRAWSETPKAGFLMTRLILILIGLMTTSIWGERAAFSAIEYYYSSYFQVCLFVFFFFFFFLFVFFLGGGVPPRVGLSSSWCQGQAALFDCEAHCVFNIENMYQLRGHRHCADDQCLCFRYTYR